MLIALLITKKAPLGEGGRAGRRWLYHRRKKYRIRKVMPTDNAMTETTQMAALASTTRYYTRGRF